MFYNIYALFCAYINPPPGNIHAPLDYICKTFVQNPLSGILPATVFNLNFLT